MEEANAKLLEAGAKRAVMLNVSGPFHSAMLAEAGRKLGEVLWPGGRSISGYSVCRQCYGSVRDEGRGRETAFREDRCLLPSDGNKVWKP